MKYFLQQKSIFDKLVLLKAFQSICIILYQFVLCVIFDQTAYIINKSFNHKDELEYEIVSSIIHEGPSFSYLLLKMLVLYIKWSGVSLHLEFRYYEWNHLLYIIDFFSYRYSFSYPILIMNPSWLMTAYLFCSISANVILFYLAATSSRS